MAGRKYLVLLSLAALFFALTLDLPSPTPSPNVAVQESKPTGKRAHFSPKYPFAKIESEFRQKELGFGKCLASSRQFQKEELNLSATWSPSGKLKGLEIRENISQDLKTCITNVVRTFSVPPHPGLQPFGYEMVVRL